MLGTVRLIFRTFRWGQTQQRPQPSETFSGDCERTAKKQALSVVDVSALLGGRSVALEQHGQDPLGRTLATIYVRSANGDEWLNVSEPMVALGHAWVMRAYYDHLPKDHQAKLNRLEAWAKSKKAGLWRTENPTPPWRKQKNSG